MAEQEQRITIDVLDMLVPSRSQTGRAVDLARLFHDECTRLLDLYREKESFLPDHTPEKGRIVSLSPDTQEPSIEEQVQLLHSALRQCLGLLHCLILKEEEEMGELEGEYETLRKNVRTRLEHLLHSTRVLVEADGTTVEITPDHQCNEEVDGMLGSFAIKMWTHRVLLELIHWADHASQTLHVLHTQKAGTGEV